MISSFIGFRISQSSHVKMLPRSWLRESRLCSHKMQTLRWILHRRNHSQIEKRASVLITPRIFIHNQLNSHNENVSKPTITQQQTNFCVFKTLRQNYKQIKDNFPGPNILYKCIWYSSIKKHMWRRLVHGHQEERGIPDSSDEDAGCRALILIAYFFHATSRFRRQSRSHQTQPMRRYRLRIRRQRSSGISGRIIWSSSSTIPTTASRSVKLRFRAYPQEPQLYQSNTKATALSVKLTISIQKSPNPMIWGSAQTSRWRIGERRGTRLRLGC